jgi:hypothetical protein
MRVNCRLCLVGENIDAISAHRTTRAGHVPSGHQGGARFCILASSREAPRRWNTGAGDLNRLPEPSGDAQCILFNKAGGLFDITGSASWQRLYGPRYFNPSGDTQVHEFLHAFADFRRAVTDCCRDGIPVTRVHVARFTPFPSDILSEILNDIRPGQDGGDIVERRETRL